MDLQFLEFEIIEGPDEVEVPLKYIGKVIFSNENEIYCEGKVKLYNNNFANCWRKKKNIFFLQKNRLK